MLDDNRLKKTILEVAQLLSTAARRLNDWEETDQYNHPDLYKSVTKHTDISDWIVYTREGFYFAYIYANSLLDEHLNRFHKTHSSHEVIEAVGYHCMVVFRSFAHYNFEAGRFTYHNNEIAYIHDLFPDCSGESGKDIFDNYKAMLVKLWHKDCKTVHRGYKKFMTPQWTRCVAPSFYKPPKDRFKAMRFTLKGITDGEANKSNPFLAHPARPKYKPRKIGRGVSAHT